MRESLFNKPSPRSNISKTSAADGESFHRMIVDAAQDQIVVIDRELRVAFINLVAAAAFSKSTEEITGNRIKDFLSPPFMERIEAALMRVFSEGVSYSLETTLVQSGKNVWLQTSFTPVFDGDGKVTHAVARSRDVSNLKDYEDYLVESSGLFEALIQTSPDAITIADLGGRIMNASKQTIEMLACSEKDILQKSLFDFIAPEDHARAMANIKRTMEAGIVRNVEYTLVRFDGSRFIADVNSSVIRDANGAAKGIIGVCRDVTVQKKIEKALLESERRFKELWDNAPVAYHTVDTQGTITAVNQTEARMLGYFVEEMVGKPVFNFILSEQRQEAKERFNLKIANKEVSRSENRVYVRKDGSRVSVSIDDVLEYDDDGKVNGVRTTMVNMTERKRAEEGLKESLLKLHLTMESTIQAMAKIVEMKDPYTAGHQRRVAKLAAAIARENGLPGEQVDSIHMASIIHDIGKIYVPSEILSKPGKLTEIEFGMIKTHPKVSFDILKMVEFPWPIAKIVLQHHERIDGSGYPLGLTGDDIMIEAKILSVADVVEAIAFHRPYRSAVGITKALEEISLKRSVLYDAKAVDACLRLFNEKGFAFD